MAVPSLFTLLLFLKPPAKTQANNCIRIIGPTKGTIKRTAEISKCLFDRKKKFVTRVKETFIIVLIIKNDDKNRNEENNTENHWNYEIPQPC